MRNTRLHWGVATMLLFSVVAPASAQSSVDLSHTQPASSQPPATMLPDSPGTQIAPPAPTQQLTQSSSAQQSSQVQEPVGTAAARTAATSGSAVSEPAGAAIAPAKQRRVRIFLIKMGAILGAGAAVGAVAALSAGSPSRPAGAH